MVKIDQVARLLTQVSKLMALNKLFTPVLPGFPLDQGCYSLASCSTDLTLTIS